MTIQEAKTLKRGDIVFDKRTGTSYEVWFTRFIPKDKSAKKQDAVAVEVLLQQKPVLHNIRGVGTAEVARTRTFGHKRLACQAD